MLNLYSWAGHGGKDPGASSNGTLEKNLTLDIDRRFSEIMSKYNGVHVQRGRTTDVFTEPNKRASMVKNSKAQICIDHHINANAGKPGTGAEVAISIYSNHKLANLILEELGKIGLTTREILQKKNSEGKDHYYMHRQTGSVETVIVEYGFINNDEDRANLLKESFRQQCAQAVATAVLRYKGIVGIDTPIAVLPDRSEIKVEIKPQNSIAPLVVDGIWGEKTTRALQRYFHTPEDGVISKPSIVIKAIQGRVGAKQDGYIGPDTIRKMQKHFDTPIDGVISEPSLMVKEMQRKLNEDRF